MTFTDPLWLLLVLPLGAAVWLWRPVSRALLVLRALLLLLVLLALAGLAVELPSRAGVIVAVVDRSLSMPAAADAVERETVTAIESGRGGESRVGVVSFGRGAQIELLPEGTRFSELRMAAGEDGSNLHDGIEGALSMIPRDAPGRIVVVSDGRWTGRDPSAAALRAAARGVTIDYRVVARSAAADVAIDRVDAPASVSPGESFVVAGWIAAPRAQEVTIELKSGTHVIASGKHALAAGTNRIAFRDRAGSAGTMSYTFHVQAAQDDPVPENNRARVLVGVSGPKPVLVVSGPKSRLPALLASSGVDVSWPEQPDFSLDALSNHSAVLLENVPAEEIGTAAVQSLASWVSEGGGALMLTGGRSSFASGGYFKSPLDPLLPVSMELRREHRKLSVAIVIALDRSGSMGMEAGMGKTKMDLANVSAAQVLALLSPQDELGVVAVDSSSHIVADLDPIEGRDDLRDRILAIESGGGGIFVYEALSTASRMLLTAQAATRHIILFADAADSEEPGMYRELLAECEKANITVTVVALGKSNDTDAGLLRDIARRGGGRIFFTEDAHDLPRLFAQDTFIVARSAFVDDVTRVKPTAALFSLTGRSFDGMPAVGGFNLTYLKNGASAAVLTEDEYHAPLVAAWQAGAGRVLTYAGEIDGTFTGPLANWSEVGAFYSSLVRWTAGARNALPGDMLVTQRVENGVAQISLQLDPERTSTPITQLPRVTTLAGHPGGGTPQIARTEMTWRTPDELAIDVPMTGSATYLSSVDVPGVGRVTLPPVALPYSPELAPAGAGEGRAALERIARATGGRERVSVADIWRDMPRRPRHVPLRPWLALAAIFVLLLEVLERRTRLLSSMSLPEWTPVNELARRMKPRKPAKAPVAPPVEPPSPEAPPSAPPSEATPLIDALEKAGKRAKRRV